jgi:dTDP-4-dehydrorhamnose reductase
MVDAKPVVLITGATGLLGPYLATAFDERATVVTSARRGGDLLADLTSPAETDRLLSSVRPQVVVHAAAMTDVDACERQPDAAYALNHDAVAHIVDRLPIDAQVVMISTDQVYPDCPGPHREGSEKPVNRYGLTKLAGEHAAAAHPRCLILRTNFFGPSRTPGRESLSDFVTSRLVGRTAMTLFGDVRFNPLHMDTLAGLVVEAVVGDLRGVFNAGSRVGCTKLDFGMAMARHLALCTDEVTAGRSDDLPGRAARPHDLRMDVRRLEAALGISLPEIDEEVKKL